MILVPSVNCMVQQKHVWRQMPKFLTIGQFPAFTKYFGKLINYKLTDYKIKDAVH